MDILGVCMGLWLMAWLSEERQSTPPAPPAPAPPVPAASGPPALLDPETVKAQIRTLRLYQSIAQAREDWRMSDDYRDAANRIPLQQEQARLAANRALRTRILGADRAQDFE